MTSERNQKIEPESFSELNESRHSSLKQRLIEVACLMVLFFVYAGDAPPMVNEAHYLVKAKNFWQPEWCSEDLFASSGKAHTVFYAIFGWPTQFISLEATAWLGRLVGWIVLAMGLVRLSKVFVPKAYASLVVGVVWIAGIEYGNLAGEWVVGGIEAKVPAYGLVLSALADLVSARWNRVWIQLGIASAFHVLTGGWAVIAAMAGWMTVRFLGNQRQSLSVIGLIIGGILSLPGLIPAIQLTAATSPQDAAEAAKIYSNYRISHHLLPTAFATWWYVRHSVLLGLLAAFSVKCLRLTTDKDGGASGSEGAADQIRSDRERLLAVLGFAMGAIGIAMAGLLIGMVPMIEPELTSKLLRFYWFRLSDAVVPLSLALLTAKLLLENGRNYNAILALFVTLGSTIAVGYSSMHRITEGVPPSVSSRILGWDSGSDSEANRQIMRDWIKVCVWAKESTPPSEVFLTPRHQQTFKWYSDRAEVVNWKDVPQDAKSLLEWKSRFEVVFPEYLGFRRTTISYSKLRLFRDQYGVRFMIVDRRVVGDNLPLVRLYPQVSTDNLNYAVYELPR